jgi:hypothetical protein
LPLLVARGSEHFSRAVELVAGGITAEDAAAIAALARLTADKLYGRD